MADPLYGVMPDDDDMFNLSSAIRDSGLLKVDVPHQINWEESAAASGIPTIYLHDGPAGTLGQGAYRTKFGRDRSNCRY